MAAGLRPNEGGVTITRRTLYDEIDRLDAEIAEFNERKSEIFDAYRQQLKNGGCAKEDVAAEITACKKAFRRLRALDKDADAVLEADALVDEIVVELQAPIRRLKPLGTNPATRVHRARTRLAASTSSPPTRGDEAAPRVPSGAASPISDESRANARDEAMPQDSPQGVGKVERASRLVTGRTVTPGRDGRTPAPISEAAPALGDAFRTDATSSRFAVSTQQVTSLPDGGNLAGAIPGHSLSETDAVVLPGSIVEPAVVEVSIPSDEIEPVREAGLPAGSPLSETDAAGARLTSIAEPAARVLGLDCTAGSPIPDTDPSLDIMTQPFYRGGATWPR
jgi:hypothetical protein